jgi:hypothetical protein
VNNRDPGVWQRRVSVGAELSKGTPMSPWLGYIVTFLITVVAATAVFFVWIANRKRIAAETIGRAEEQALRIIRDAEREIDTNKKEGLLDAM